MPLTKDEMQFHLAVGQGFDAVLEHEQWVKQLEREFWEQTFCAALCGMLTPNEEHLLHVDAAEQADAALEEWRKRWAK